MGITIGLMVGAANKKPIAAELGNPCRRKRRATGTLPHSHTGKRKPIQLPAIAPNNGFLGILAINFPSSMNRSKALDKDTPNSKNGKASTSKLRNKVKAWCNWVIIILLPDQAGSSSMDVS